MNLANLNLVNDEFIFDDDGKKPVTDAIDYAHLYIRNLNTSASGLSLSSENYKGEIKMLSLSEKSGFELKRLSTGFYYSDQQAGVNDLILMTNNTNLRNKTVLNYASIASLSEKPGDLAADLVFDHSSYWDEGSSSPGSCVKIQVAQRAKCADKYQRKNQWQTEQSQYPGF